MYIFKLQAFTSKEDRQQIRRQISFSWLILFCDYVFIGYTRNNWSNEFVVYDVNDYRFSSQHNMIILFLCHTKYYYLKMYFFILLHLID